MNLTVAEISKIAAYVMPDVVARPSDIALVFGTRHGVEDFCREIFDLWNRRFFARLVISGGTTAGLQTVESEVMADRLVQMGLPVEMMTLECRATNTAENVIFSKDLVEETIGLGNIKSVLAIGKVCSGRRYLMTLQQHWPEVKISGYWINYFGVPKDNWHQDDVFRSRVLGEYAKIPLYLERGFIRELDPIASPTAK